MKDLQIQIFCTGNSYFFYITFNTLLNLLIYIIQTLITYSVKYSFSGLNWYLLPLLKKLFWYFCLVIREFKKRLRDTQLTCKTKEKRAVFWLLLFFKGVIYVYAHEYFWLMLSSSDAWYCCIPKWIWIRKQFSCMLFCQNQTTSFIMLFMNAHNLRSKKFQFFIHTIWTNDKYFDTQTLTRLNKIPS